MMRAWGRKDEKNGKAQRSSSQFAAKLRWFDDEVFSSVLQAANLK